VPAALPGVRCSSGGGVAAATLTGVPGGVLIIRSGDPLLMTWANRCGLLSLRKDSVNDLTLGIPEP
jgi:hypothetical protein